MNLAFRFQFSLAPVLIVALLACLVAYTLIELVNIRKENETTVKWEMLTDRVQLAIANIALMENLLLDLSKNPLGTDDDRLFGYLEQTRILADSLLDPVLIDDIPDELQSHLHSNAALLSELEQVEPTKIQKALAALLPELQYQHKIFLAQRRSAFLDYHRNLSIIVPRLSGALLTVLIVCIVLAIGLTLWGLAVLRRRLRLLGQYAHSISIGDTVSLSEPTRMRDELDKLEFSLAHAAKRLKNVFANEKILQGAEKERRRIAMELHDGVLSDLTTLSRKIDKLKTTLPDTQQIELGSDADDIINSIRNTIDDLHPQTLEILGLEAALRSFIDRHLRLPGSPAVQFEFDPGVEKYLPASQMINLFRIITEAVHNVLRHARCSRFELSLRLVSQNLIVTIEDNGVGMPERVGTTGHGCANIIERARALGGNVTWRQSRFDSGTCVELILTR